MRRWAIVLSLALVGSLCATQAGAYRWTRACGRDIDWRHDSTTIGGVTADFPPGSAVRSAWEEAEKQWNNAPGSFSFGIGSYGEEHYGRSNADNEVWFTSSQDILDGHPAMAIRSWGCFHFAEADIVFDSTLKWSYDDSAPAKTSYGGDARNFRSGALHELGHALGLQHENRYYNIMGSDSTHVTRNNDTVRQGPGEDGIRGMEQQYGSGSDLSDFEVSHFKYGGESGEYSSHVNTAVYRDGQPNSLQYSSTGGVRLYPVMQHRPYKVEFTFENNGEPGTTSNVGYGIYLSTDKIIDTSDPLIKTGNLSLYANLPDTVQIPVTFPALNTGATYYVGAIIDRTDAYDEYNEANNATYLPVRAVAGCSGWVNSPGSDFNGDGICDAAIGVPGEDGSAGVVNVVFGGPKGLTKLGNETLSQRVIGNGHHEAGDRFGQAVAAGDFDGDGYADLAVGVPGENSGAGSVVVYSGTSIGFLFGTLKLVEPVRLDQGTPGVEGVPEKQDKFGQSLTSGDFNGDGFIDLATSAISENGGRGCVTVFYGSPGGLTGNNSELWTQDSEGIIGAAEPGDGFGNALAAGTFDGDGFADLAIGVSGEDDNAGNAGAVNVIYGSASGLTSTDNQIWTQDTPGIEGTESFNNQFGTALAVGDFNNDARDDLAIGSPRDGEIAEAGAVNVIYGSGVGLSTVFNTIWSQAQGPIMGTAEPGDHFGAALAAGDFDGDGADDLGVGIPDEVTDGLQHAGAVQVLYGYTGTGIDDPGNFVFTEQPLTGDLQEDTKFGAAVGAVNIDGDLDSDLLAGSPGRDYVYNASDEPDFPSLVGTNGAGVVHVLFGGGGGVDTDFRQLINQDVMDSIPEDNDGYGGAVNTRQGF